MKQSKSRRPAAAAWIGVLVAVGMVGAIVYGGVSKSRQDAADKAAKWESQGPVCELLAALPAGERMSSNVTQVQDVQFRRASGHVACTEIGDDQGRSDRLVPVCQFTSPSVVEVKTPKGTFVFRPGPGLPATIIVRAGQPECASAGNNAVFND